MQTTCNIKIVGIGRKIFAKTVDEKAKITDYLKEKKLDFFTHPDIDNKIFKVILSGLPQVPIEKIEKSLISDHEIKPTKIIMFNTKARNKLYLVHFNKSEVNLKMLNDVKAVYYQIVKWLPFKPKRNGPTQCYRCCMYGHGASQCNRYPVCIICSGNHITSECTIKQTENTNPSYKCFNCASAGIAHNHKANDAKCPFRAKYEEARTNSRTNKNKSKSQHKTEETTTTKGEQRFVQAPKPAPLGRHSMRRTLKNEHFQQHQQQNARTQTKISIQTQMNYGLFQKSRICYSKASTS